MQAANTLPFQNNLPVSVPDISRSSWVSDVDNPFTAQVPEFTGKLNVNLPSGSPCKLFLQLFPLELVDKIVFSTNLYAGQCGKFNLGVTRELKERCSIFLEINFIMTYICYPQVRMYWSSDSSLRMNHIADKMSVRRWEEIQCYIHFTDNSKHNNKDHDRLWKICPVLNTLQRTFLEAVDPEEFQSIDEIMIPFKGCSHLKQYIKSKPKPWGCKVWVCAEVSGYMYEFEVYQEILYLDHVLMLYIVYMPKSLEIFTRFSLITYLSLVHSC